eukprot:24468_1
MLTTLFFVISALSVYNVASTECGNYNYAFVLDESGSVGQTNYDASIDFVIDLIQGHISDDVQLAGIAFSDGNDLVYHFNQPQLPRGTEVPPTGIIGEFTIE